MVGERHPVETQRESLAHEVTGGISAVGGVAVHVEVDPHAARAVLIVDVGWPDVQPTSGYRRASPDRAVSRGISAPYGTSMLSARSTRSSRPRFSTSSTPAAEGHKMTQIQAPFASPT